MTNGNLIEVQGLRVHYPAGARSLLSFGDKRVVKAVDDISFAIKRGEMVGLVGESGCGKSTTGRAMLRLVKPTDGRVLYQGRDLASLKNSELRPLRRNLQMVFQDPYSSLDPRMTVGSIIGEAISTLKSATDAKARVKDLLEQVGLSSNSINRYPHEFSGGQRQRIAIARALATQPEFIVADEPISALDVSIQAQVMNLLKQLRRDMGLAFLFISHDLRAVRHMSDRVAVMYLGKLVEIADANSIYKQPLHPYTQALISAVPIPNPKLERERQRIRLKGDVPSAINPPAGCRFNTRCQYVEKRCFEEEPSLRQVGQNHYVSCHLVQLSGPNN
ncbi:MAG TPA: oligopeptide/dipeptide ABC transporter ATP-binding protein [Blastocatellia bacterium]|nr:oligopeptide/dipeptide ABC transporter ATP-binding protein [Blastocatellia bacterium]